MDEVKSETAEASGTEKPEEVSEALTQPLPLENGEMKHARSPTPIPNDEAETQKIEVSDEVEVKTEPEPAAEVKSESPPTVPEVKEESEVKKEESKPEPTPTPTLPAAPSILPKIFEKSKSLNLEVDSEERMTRLKSTGLYKLGHEGGFRNYVNKYSSDPLALSKIQHGEERDKRRQMSHKFSLTPASDCKWLGVQYGFRASLVGTLRTTLLHMENAIPTTLMHCNWALLRKPWIAAVTGCSSPKEFSKALTALASCLRPCVFNPVWTESTGHVKLLRTNAVERENRKKIEKRDKKDRDDEEERLRLLPQLVKYSIPPKHQVRAVLV
jgi:nucleosome-remodeling factor subunit BPTF